MTVLLRDKRSRFLSIEFVHMSVILHFVSGLWGREMNAPVAVQEHTRHLCNSRYDARSVEIVAACIRTFEPLMPSGMSEWYLVIREVNVNELKECVVVSDCMLAALNAHEFIVQ